jgi:hypothetical protein
MEWRGVASAAVVVVGAVTLLTAPARRPAEGQPGGRAGAVRTPAVVDGAGRVVGPLLSLHGLGLPQAVAEVTPGLVARQADVGVVALEQGGRVLQVGVARDRFVGAPAFSSADTQEREVGVPLYLVLFDGLGCAGNAYLLSLLVGDSGDPTPYVPGLLPRAGVGPGNTLYVESGAAPTTAPIQSIYYSFEQFCQTSTTPGTPTPFPVVAATLEADLDDLFTPPFRVELR